MLGQMLINAQKHMLSSGLKILILKGSHGHVPCADKGWAGWGAPSYPLPRAPAPCACGHRRASARQSQRTSGTAAGWCGQCAGHQSQPRARRLGTRSGLSGAVCVRAGRRRPACLAGGSSCAQTRKRDSMGSRAEVGGQCGSSACDGARPAPLRCPGSPAGRSQPSPSCILDHGRGGAAARGAQGRPRKQGAGLASVQYAGSSRPSERDSGPRAARAWAEAARAARSATRGGVRGRTQAGDDRVL